MSIRTPCICVRHLVLRFAPKLDALVCASDFGSDCNNSTQILPTGLGVFFLHFDFIRKKTSNSSDKSLYLFNLHIPKIIGEQESHEICISTFRTTTPIRIPETSSRESILLDPKNSFRYGFFLVSFYSGATQKSHHCDLAILRSCSQVIFSKLVGGTCSLRGATYLLQFP